MKCEYCGGPVEWKGSIIALTHTECLDCGAVNCQIVESEDQDADFEEHGDE